MISIFIAVTSAIIAALFILVLGFIALPKKERKQRMKKIKNLILVTLISGMSLLIMSGCAYANNQNWNDLTPEEQEKVRQTFNDVKKDLETMDIEGCVQDTFTDSLFDTLNKVEQKIEKEN